MIKRLLFFISCLLVIGISSVRANSEFKTDYTVDYVYDSAGRSTVTEHISLTNLTSKAYATSYSLHLQGAVPQNIAGSDELGPLKIDTVSQTDTDTTINVRFNNQVVGRGNTLKFILTYNTTPASHNGQVWEIILPRLNNPQDIDSYRLRLTIPDNFGQPAFISPPPDSSSDRTFIFSKEQMANVGVVASFGNLQNYNFTLHYHLPYPLTHIFLPPDTGYQKVVYSAITPPPLDVQTDPDGNWIASYRLKPHTTLDITATGQVRVLSQPAQSLFTESPEQLRNYIQDEGPEFKALADTYPTPKQIYDYTKSTDLFIKIARAAGIPTRRVDGLIYNHPDLQSWPEYWNGASWVINNPDLNHFAFVIHSLLPSKAVPLISAQITHAPYQEPSPQPLELSWHPPFQLFPFISWSSPLTVVNNQHAALYRVPITVAVENLNLTTPATGNIDLLPPYGHYTIPVAIKTPVWPDYQSKFIHFGVGSRRITYNIRGQVYLAWQITLGIIISFTIISLGYVAHQAWGVHLQKRPKGDSVCGQSQGSA